jgi:hypothetical protein
VTGLVSFFPSMVNQSTVFPLIDSNPSTDWASWLANVLRRISPSVTTPMPLNS